MKRQLLVVMLLTITIFLANCTDNPSKSKKDNGDAACYILCEGNFQTPTASLWSYDGKEATGPICWDLDLNPLGDTGQSTCLVDGKLFVLVNASNQIKVMDTETNEQLAVLDLGYFSPRYMAVKGDYGYVTGWNPNGILKVDVNRNSIVDTISIDGFTEDIIIDGDYLYTSLTMNTFWGSENKVLKIDIAADEPEVVQSYEVISGPGQMVLKNDELWVASTYYDDAWQSIAGMSKIDLNSGQVTRKDYGVNFNFQKDLVNVDGDIYRTYQNGLVKIDDNLNYNEAEKIGNFGGLIYSASVNDDEIFCGVTDYAAPDTVFVMDKNGEILETLKVGALPTYYQFLK